LLKLYYCNYGLVKKTNQKDLVKTIGSKSTRSKWHFDQVGHGGQKTIWGVLFTNIHGKKTMISCNDRFASAI